MLEDEFFGSDEQRALLRRGRAMYDLFASDPRFSYYGRTVALVRPADGGIEKLAALARVQGNSAYVAAPEHMVGAIESELSDRGLVPHYYAKWEGADTTLAFARNVVQTNKLPEDLTLLRVDASTPGEQVDSLAKTALTCGVLPLCGEALRGLIKPAVCMVAIDRAGKVVSCAAASALTHPDHPSHAGQAWWGMLATRPERRGQRLSLILGAHVMLEMQSRFGLHDFMTGVEPGNAPTEAICTRMGMAPRGQAIIGCVDPQVLASGRMTK